MSRLVSIDRGVVVASFDDRHWAEWTASGDSVFGSGPVEDRRIRAEIGAIDSERVVSSFAKTVGQTGRLASRPFRISDPYLNFRIGGSDFEFVTCLNVVVDGRIVRSETGRGTSQLHAATLDLGAWLGQEAHAEIVDLAPGERGHLSVSTLSLSPTPATPADPTSLYRESLRPRLHFTARQWAMRRSRPGHHQEGWLNDINGLVYFGGEYHLFAQRWSTCWLHAVSTDLIHWTEISPAFYEETLGSGVQSGSCVVDVENTSGLGADGTPPMIAFWSRNDNRSQCISYSVDRGRSWTHYRGNPIFEMPERDPMVFRDHRREQWVMVLYGAGHYTLLASPDLLKWHQLDCTISDSYECPDFFELPIEGSAESKWVLVQGDGRYSIGGFDGRSFIDETGRLTVDGGPNFYATQTWGSIDGTKLRRVQVAWMRGGSYPQMPFNQQVSIPCDLSLHQTSRGLRLFRTPVPELASLVRAHYSWPRRRLEQGDTWSIGSAWPLLRVLCELEVDEDSELLMRVCGVEIRTGPGDISVLDVRQPTINRVSKVDVIVDLTSAEVFANSGEASLSACVFAGQPDLVLEAKRGGCIIENLRVEELDSIWDRTASNAEH